MSRNFPGVQGTEEGRKSILYGQHRMNKDTGMKGIKKKTAIISGLKYIEHNFQGMEWTGRHQEL